MGRKTPPARVSRTPRPVRSKSRCPSPVSSPCTRALTDGCVRNNDVAALAKLPYVATTVIVFAEMPPDWNLVVYPVCDGHLEGMLRKAKAGKCRHAGVWPFWVAGGLVEQMTRKH